MDYSEPLGFACIGRTDRQNSGWQAQDLTLHGFDS